MNEAISLMVLLLAVSIPSAMAQTQSHPLSQISADTSLSLNNYNLTNAAWLVYNTGIVAGGVRGIPGADIQPSAITPSLISAGAVGSTKLSNPLMGPINVSGALNASSFYDYDNSNYYLDPASTGTSLVTAGSIVAGGWLNATNINVSSNAYFGGNVGIGTASPGAPLEVYSANIFNTTTGANPHLNINYIYSGTIGGPALKFSRVGVTDWTAIQADLAGGTRTLKFIQTSSGVASTQMVIDANTGNVGIGTASPTSSLHVTGGSGILSDYGVIVGNSGGWSPLMLKTGTANTKWYMYSSNGGYGAENLVLHYNYTGTPQMIITNTGNVGIGTTGPGSKLDVRGGDLRVNGVLGFTDSAGTPYTDNWIGRYNDGAVDWLHIGGITTGGVRRIGLWANTIFAAGNVGLGTTNPQNALNVVGDINATGNIYGKYVTTQNNIAGSRALSTVYQNTLGRPMFVSVSDQSGVSNHHFQAYSDSANPPATLVSYCFADANGCGVAFFVLPGNYYKVLQDSGADSIRSWIEWS